jgi:hypothetical protein
VLQEVIENMTIIVAGRWNVAIFAPAWLGEHVFHGFGKNEVVIEFEVQPLAPPRITCAGVLLMPSPMRILAAPTSTEQEVVERTELAVCRLLTVLQHTPVTAVGINFGFKTDPGDIDLTKHFADTDNACLSSLDLSIQGTGHSWKLKTNDRILNLDCKVNSGRVEFAFNYHAEVTSAALAQELISGKVNHLRNESLKILKDVYEVTL